MSTNTQSAELARRVQDLYASDAQFAAARPDEAVSAAMERPGLRLPQLVQTVMEGYADRPALGQRAVQLLKGGAVSAVELMDRASIRSVERAASTT